MLFDDYAQDNKERRSAGSMREVQRYERHAHASVTYLGRIAASAQWWRVSLGSRLRRVDREGQLFTYLEYGLRLEIPN